ncbi:nucleoporin NUP188-like [Apostichopus japonicus]|uniref:nucleoporin NUP188-like n=1 Tax=Stichopus japonicus TaxID=307972 RepID=UPI003AB14A36
MAQGRTTSVYQISHALICFCTSRSSQELLFIISGHSSIKSKELIKDELNDNKTRLLDGITIFKPHSSGSETKLKADKSVDHLEQRFLLLLSKFLDLDALQCQELFGCYLQHAFRGTGQQLQSILKDERSIQALILKVCDFYRSERLHLIHAIKHIIGFCQDSEHTYQVR